MPEFIVTHNIGTEEILLKAAMTYEEACRIRRQEIGHVFMLREVSVDNSGIAELQFVPSRGCMEVIRPDDPATQGNQ